MRKLCFMPLDVRRLRVLRELAERGTVAATAEALSFTPSAVSQQLSALEREAGVVLLEREGRRLALTDAGRTLVAHADAVLAQLERAEADLRAGASEITGTLRVAAFSSFARSVLPGVTAAMLVHERLDLHVRDAEPQDSLPLLRLGEVDVVIAQRFPYVPREFGPAFHVEELFDDPLHLATGPGHHDAVPRFADLEGRPWVAGHPGTSCHEVVQVRLPALGDLVRRWTASVPVGGPSEPSPPAPATRAATSRGSSASPTTSRSSRRSSRAASGSR